MQSRDYRDMIGGMLMIGLGAFVAYYSPRYGLGTFRRMGSGMFPTLVGYALCISGALIVLPALYKAKAETTVVEWRALILVLGSLGLFAVTVNAAGMIPSIFLLTIGAAYADGRLKLLGILVLATVLSVLAVLIFHFFLNTALSLFKWPF